MKKTTSKKSHDTVTVPLSTKETFKCKNRCTVISTLASLCEISGQQLYRPADGCRTADGQISIRTGQPMNKLENMEVDG